MDRANAVGKKIETLWTSITLAGLLLVLAFGEAMSREIPGATTLTSRNIHFQRVDQDNYEVDQAYGFEMRMLYLPCENREQILELVRSVREEWTER